MRTHLTKTHAKGRSEVKKIVPKKRKVEQTKDEAKKGKVEEEKKENKEINDLDA